ncbi:MAG: hypothetical protein HGA86_05595, partial [Anaerolineaceae bacterium]|nr:hypothetical protein [Anaerolineaceae bacterium]
GNVYVADTWNQRIQVFAPSDDGKAYFPTRSWDVNGWLSQTLDNKPFLAVDENNNVFITDPEGYRILQFKPDGAFVRGWGEYSPTTDGFGLPLGIAAGPDGKIWVSDSINSVVLKFTLP